MGICRISPQTITASLPELNEPGGVARRVAGRRNGGDAGQCGAVAHRADAIEIGRRRRLGPWEELLGLFRRAARRARILEELQLGLVDHQLGVGNTASPAPSIKPLI